MVIHTKNQPWFLVRLMEYYNKKLGATGMHIVILDGSDDEHFSIIGRELGNKRYALSMKLLHYPESFSIADRLADALPQISTPYILLAADDDLYYFEWIGPAVELLDADPSYGVVYGHTLCFELDCYAPAGKLVKIEFSRPNPPARWLEGDTPLERLMELGMSDWTTTGWYALQRKDLLSDIVMSARRHKLNGYHFERFLIFCQAAMTKTKMLDYVYLARQICNGKRRPYSFKKERRGLDRLLDASVEMLSRHPDVDKGRARAMVEDASRAEIDQLRQNDARKYLRATADRFGFLRQMKSHMRTLFKGAALAAVHLHPDNRFPVSPEISLEYSRIADIKELISCAQPMPCP